MTEHQTPVARSSLRIPLIIKLFPEYSRVFVEFEVCREVARREVMPVVDALIIQYRLWSRVGAMCMVIRFRWMWDCRKSWSRDGRRLVDTRSYLRRTNRVVVTLWHVMVVMPMMLVLVLLPADHIAASWRCGDRRETE